MRAVNWLQIMKVIDQCLCTHNFEYFVDDKEALSKMPTRKTARLKLQPTWKGSMSKGCPICAYALRTHGTIAYDDYLHKSENRAFSSHLPNWVAVVLKSQVHIPSPKAFKELSLQLTGLCQLNGHYEHPTSYGLRTLSKLWKSLSWGSILSFWGYSLSMW